MAAPSIPYSAPYKRAIAIAGTVSIDNRKSKSDRPQAIKTVPEVVSTLCMVIDRQSIRKTSTAGIHCSPNTTGTKSGATAIMPSMAGKLITEIAELAFSQTEASRAGSSFIFDKVGNMTRTITELT